MKKISYRIDDWLFSPHENKLHANGTDIPLDNRLCNLLLFFCQQPNETLTREMLIQHVWSGTVLTDQVITQAVFELRKQLRAINNKPGGYIITIPKRGYKFDAQVITIDEPVVNESLKQTVIPDSTPLLSQTSPANSQPSDAIPKKTLNLQKTTRRTTLLKGSFILILAVIIAWFSWTQLSSYTFTANKQASDDTITHNIEYLAYEPRYIHIIIDESIMGNNLASGFIHKLIEYLKTYKDFRTAFQGQQTYVSAKVITFSLATINNKQYLDIEYKNRISDYKHLDRKYELRDDNIKSTLRRSLDDLLDAFNIDIPKEHIAALVDELPENDIATKASLTAFGAVFNGFNRRLALRAIDAALTQAPSNHYLISMNYIFQMIDIFLGKSKKKDQLIQILNDQNGKQLLAISNDPQSHRVYEALAMYYLSKDHPQDALKALNRVPINHYDIIYHVVSAKINESFGNTAAAEENYFKAIIEANSIDSLELIQSLFFYSDLSHIKEKLPN